MAMRHHFIIGTLWLFAFMGTTCAEPITIHGINWSMSIPEQISALERNGLACVKEPGWDSLYPPQDGAMPKAKISDTLCIQSSDNKNTIASLRSLFSEWRQLCNRSENGKRTLECMRFERFKMLKDAVAMVSYRDDNTITFLCKYIGSCGIAGNTVVEQLKQTVIHKAFLPPTKDSFVSCADGYDGDSICVHYYSKAIWLMKRPLRDNSQGMKF